jgi:NADPH-dependent curcumin reductase CurA
MVQNKSFLYAEVPETSTVSGKHLKVQTGVFDLDAARADGGFTGRVLHASLDPYLRHCMVATDAARDGFEPFSVGSVITNACIIQVLQSKSPGLAPGDVVVGMAPIQEYITVLAAGAKQYVKIDNPCALDLKIFLGPLGLAGLTAYSALYEVAKPQKGETIFISAALGAVGQMVGQLSKREGLNVIGSVGSDGKLKILVEKLGYDAGFNYRHGDIVGQLKRLAPDGIDSN